MRADLLPGDATRTYERDEEGRTVLKMHVKDDTDFLSVFSAQDTPVISTQVAEFLENTTHGIRPDEPLSLHICSSCIEREEQGLYRTAIHQYYAERYLANARELRHQHIFAWALALIGVLVLTLTVYLQYRHSSVIWAEVVDIVAWVFLWEAVDIRCFRTRELVMQRRRYAAFMNMTVHYESPSDAQP